jgi:hypothetical protein
MAESCKNLRTKKMFIPHPEPNTEPTGTEPAGGSSHFWCNRTLTEVGADDQPVHPSCCKPGRRCFEE